MLSPNHDPDCNPDPDPHSDMLRNRSTNPELAGEDHSSVPHGTSRSHRTAWRGDGDVMGISWGWHGDGVGVQVSWYCLARHLLSALVLFLDLLLTRT